MYFATGCLENISLLPIYLGMHKNYKNNLPLKENGKIFS